MRASHLPPVPLTSEFRFSSYSYISLVVGRLTWAPENYIYKFNVVKRGQGEGVYVMVFVWVNLAKVPV